MKPAPILIVRRPGARSGSGNRQRLSSHSFVLHPCVEFLFLDIRESGQGGSWGTAVDRQVVQKNGESLAVALEKVVKSFIDPHMPEMILIHRDDDRSGWDEKTVHILSKLVPDIAIYTEKAPCPKGASQLRIGSIEPGRDLAEHLAYRSGQAMAGTLEFVVDPEILERGVKGILEILSPWMKLPPGFLTFCLRWPVKPKMDFYPIAEILPYLFEKGLAMIHWEVAGSGSLPKELLWKVSKQGVWNHVSGRNLFDPDRIDRFWMVNTPNIIHSFQDVGPGATNAGVIPPTDLLTYGKLPPLPGRPLWQVIRDPGLLLPYLDQIPKQQLLRMRVDDTGAIYGIGTSITYLFKRPDQIPGDLMEEIIAMVDAGGSVDITHVRANLKRAYLVGYAMENGRVAGNSSLKHPRQAFIDRLCGMTGLDFTRCVERGYTSVRPEYRAMGIGAKLLEGLTARAVGVKVFSIISEDNLVTQKIAIRNNTQKITTYFSHKLGKKMGVWMPGHMIPVEWDLLQHESGQQESVKQKSGKQESGK